VDDSGVLDICALELRGCIGARRPQHLGGSAGRAAQIATWVVSLVVAISASVESFFQFGQRWRNYRSTAERLKIEGWLFLQLAGPYASADRSHADAFRTFATRVEELIPVLRRVCTSALSPSFAGGLRPLCSTMLHPFRERSPGSGSDDRLAVDAAMAEPIE
jgi:hypothetical protein